MSKTNRPTLKLINWNVNGIRAVCKKGFYDFVQKENPDILCLQEIKATAEQCAEFVEATRHLQVEWYSANRPGYSGVMSLLREKPHQVSRGFGTKKIDEKFDQEGRVLISDHGDFYLLNMYFPNGGSGEERHLFKMEFLKRILDFFQKLDREKPLILTGDFNIAHKAIDIHDPVRLDGESGFMPEEREWMDHLVSAGFLDSFRHFYPDSKEKYSWWSYRQGSRRRNKGWRIDYFFVSKRFQDRLVRSELLTQIEGSDHCPLLLEIQR